MIGDEKLVCVCVYLFILPHAHEFLSLHTLQEKKGRIGTLIVAVNPHSKDGVKKLCLSFFASNRKFISQRFLQSGKVPSAETLLFILSLGVCFGTKYHLYLFCH